MEESLVELSRLTQNPCNEFALLSITEPELDLTTIIRGTFPSLNPGLDGPGCEPQCG